MQKGRVFLDQNPLWGRSVTFNFRKCNLMGGFHVARFCVCWGYTWKTILVIIGCFQVYSEDILVRQVLPDVVLLSLTAIICFNMTAWCKYPAKSSFSVLVFIWFLHTDTHARTHSVFFVLLCFWGWGCFVAIEKNQMLNSPWTSCID